MNKGRVDIYASAILELHSNIVSGEELQDVLGQLGEVDKRGYLLPSEDELLMDIYVSYLRDRGSLLELIEECQQIRNTDEDVKEWEIMLSLYAVGLSAALILKRVGDFIIKLADSSPTLLKKLDQAEGRYGLARKSFTRLYASITNPFNMIAFYEALRFYEVHEKDYSAIGFSETMRTLLGVLEEERLLSDFSKSEAVVKRLKYKWYSFKRRSRSSYVKAMFYLFKLSGSQIAEMKQPHLAKSFKNVGEEVFKEIQMSLLPGDVIVTRHVDAVSNLFLPGYWPHAAFYAGNAKQRSAMGCECKEDGYSVIEAKKDGVRKRCLSETLRVDEFIVLRSSLSEQELREVINCAISHTGKGYDFLFNFCSADRLACTEVVYRSFEPLGKIVFKLSEKAGCLCLPAEDLIDQLLASGVFRVEYCYMNQYSRLLVGAEAGDLFLAERGKLDL